MEVPLWYKSYSSANVPFWHILTYYKSSRTITWYFFNMPANVNHLLYPALFSPTFYLIQIPAYLLFLSSIVKAYSLGTFICHTTDILSYCFFYVVQWIKPPLLMISKTIISFSILPLDYSYNITRAHICQYYFYLFYI